MKKLVLSLLIFTLISISALQAQKPDSKSANPAAQPQPAVNIPVFQAPVLVEDILFAATTLNSAEITGSEVDLYLQCKNNLQGVIKYIQTNNVKNSDTLTLTFQLPVAQALVNFLGKSKFMGSQVENYRRFIDTIIQASKNAKLPEPKK